MNIPNSVTFIGEYAFQNCTGLTSVSLPTSITSIEGCTFMGCSGLVSIKLPNTIRSIKYSAFCYCNGLKAISVPSTVTSIGICAFYGCSSLESFTIPTAITTIEDGVFSSCSGLKDILIPNTITSIGDNAFSFSGLQRVSIPNSVTYIGKNAFSYCSNLSYVDIPSSVTTIGEEAFQAFQMNKSITINIEDIGKWIECLSKNSKNIFSNLYNMTVRGVKLTNLEIPESVKIIPSYCFYKCESLESITFHKDVNTILQNAFNGCSNVKTIICQSVIPPSCGANAFNGISKTDCKIIVPQNSINSYQTDITWKDFANITDGSEINPDDLETCAIPKISIVKDQLYIESSTFGSKCTYTITSEDIKSSIVEKNTLIPLSGQYTITAYATADGMRNSETVTATLVWVNPAINGGTDVINMETSKAVIISSVSNGIRLYGIEHGEIVTIYSIDGNLINKTEANDVETFIECPPGFVVVRVGNKSVKVKVV